MLEIIRNIFKQINKLIFVVVYGPVKNENQCSGTYLYNNKLIKYLTPYGLFIKPKEKSIGIGFHINGNTENSVSIPINIEFFSDLERGEVAVGIPSFNSRIYFKCDGSINIESDKAINILGSNVNIGEGGAAIARKDDVVIGKITIPGGSSAGTYDLINGKINTGSTKHTCS